MNNECKDKDIDFSCYIYLYLTLLNYFKCDVFVTKMVNLMYNQSLKLVGYFFYFVDKYLAFNIAPVFK